jgi:type III HopA1-like effector protein
VTLYRRQIEAALRAASVASPTSFTWFGRRSQPLPRALVPMLAPELVREMLIDGLQDVLYGSFYTQGRPVPVGLNGSPGRTDRAFVAALSAANAGSGGWEPGWRVERVEHGIAQVVRHGLRAHVDLRDCRGSGDLVSVRRTKETAHGSPGFYMALGDREPDAGREGIEERVYFNVRAEGALRLVAGCTRVLNDAGIAFDLKVVDDPGGTTRCDAAVLYLDRGGFRRARDAVRAIVAACGAHVYGDAPAFARPLAPGVSIAEHAPGLGASFGASRCRLLAEGIVVAHERGVTRLPDRLDEVARRFAEHGLDIDAPYLSPGSAERYAL